MTVGHSPAAERVDLASHRQEWTWGVFRLYMCVCVCVCHFSRVPWTVVTPWIVAHQAPLSMGFSRRGFWSGLPCPPPGNLPDPEIKPTSPGSPALQADSLPLSHLHVIYLRVLLWLAFLGRAWLQLLSQLLNTSVTENEICFRFHCCVECPWRITRRGRHCGSCSF